MMYSYSERERAGNVIDTKSLSCSNDSSNNSIRVQLFSLNKLSAEELRQKWLSLCKSNPNNLHRNYLIKGLAYKIQSLYGMSNTSEEEIKTCLKAAKQKLVKAKSVSYSKNNNDFDCNNINDNRSNDVSIFNTDMVSNSHISNSNRETKNNETKNIQNKNMQDRGKNNNTNNNKKPIVLPPVGSLITAYHKNNKYVVKILEDNKFSYDGRIYKSLSAIANEITGTRWSGYAFFHLK
ncbi:MAG: DUF2924 domain-containing protein [Rickettsiales bacterium]|jgi:hypothetical protein|nr:DUF2924 domain-containing protein [Rickettsiales bacterium]